MPNQKKFWKKVGGAKHESPAGVVEFRYVHRKLARKYWFTDPDGKEHGPFHDYVAATSYAEDAYHSRVHPILAAKHRKKKKEVDEEDDLKKQFGG